MESEPQWPRARPIEDQLQELRVKMQFVGVPPYDADLDDIPKRRGRSGDLSPPIARRNDRVSASTFPAVVGVVTSIPTRNATRKLKDLA